MDKLTESPGLRIIDHSKAGEGYWNYEKMAIQTEDVMTAMDTLHPNVQQLHQFDWSSGHKKSLEGGLMVNSMNINYGGKGNKRLRDTELTAGCVGDSKALMYLTTYTDTNNVPVRMWSLQKPQNNIQGVNVREVDCRVYVGQKQSMVFGTEEMEPPPPFYALNAPYKDTPILDRDGNQALTKSGKPKKKYGYAGVGKGIKQVLWERGLWKEGMVKCLEEDHEFYPELSASYVLANCDDYANEQTAMESLVRHLGHLIEFEGKGHPETAECGIEYDNGVAKRDFRRNNLQVAKNCERDARNAYLSITLRTAQRTARKARTYRRAYLDDSGQSHFLIEKYVRQVKCHRNILDMNCRDLQDMEKKAKQDKAVDEIRKNKEEMEKEQKIILKEEEDMKQHNKENRKRKREEKMKKDKDNKKRK